MDKIVDILGYEYAAKGGYITLKFESGYITKRRFTNIVFEKETQCSLSNQNFPIGTTGIYVSIKKRGYSRYKISSTTINQALAGDFKRYEKDQPKIVKDLMSFLDTCHKEKKLLNKEDAVLREALRKIKFKNSKLSSKMSAAHKLLELVTEK